MSNEDCEKILQDWGIFALPLEEQIIKIYEKVRDIRYGNIGSRKPMDVYRANKGTCSGKSFLLRELYRSIGLKTRDMICLQRWKDLTWFPDDEYGVVDFPDELLKMLEEEELVDFHNYVRFYNDGRWIQVDVSIDLELSRLGFHSVKDWDGKTDIPQVWDCGDNGFEKKAELTKQLPLNIQKAREEFLKAITAWLDEWRGES